MITVPLNNLEHYMRYLHLCSLRVIFEGNYLQILSCPFCDKFIVLPLSLKSSEAVLNDVTSPSYSASFFDLDL